MSEVETTLAAHAVRIGTLEAGQVEQKAETKTLGDKIDGLKMWIIALLGSVIVELVIHFISGAPHGTR